MARHSLISLNLTAYQRSPTSKKELIFTVVALDEEGNIVTKETHELERISLLLRQLADSIQGFDETYTFPFGF